MSAMEEGTEPPVERLRRALDGYLTTQLLYVAAKLGLAEALADGPLATAALSTAVGARPDALHRVLRGLVVEGVLAEEDGAFSLTPMGACLPQLRGTAVARGELYASAAAGLLDAVVHGGVAFEHVYGESFFAHLDAHPEHDAAFHASMTARATREAAAVVAACDLTDRHTVVDVGGGNGILLAAMLEAAPALHGLVVDRAAAIPAAREHLEASGLTDRARCVSGDFFDAVPAGRDLYVLSRVLHDWNDGDALRILRVCRKAMQSGSRLLIVDVVLPERAVECPDGVLLDLNMLVLLGGRERTASEVHDLLARAGFAQGRITPTGLPGALAVVTAEPR